MVFYSLALRDLIKDHTLSVDCWYTKLLAHMSRSTQKVGITGKYGTRYGSTLRKRVKPMEESQHAKYECECCGKKSVKRVAVGIWECRSCNYKFAGAAYAPTSPTALSFNALVKSSNK